MAREDLKDRYGNLCGYISDTGSTKTAYDRYGNKLAYYDGRYTYDRYGNKVGEGNWLSSFIPR